MTPNIFVYLKLMFLRQGTSTSVKIYAFFVLKNDSQKEKEWQKFLRKNILRFIFEFRVRNLTGEKLPHSQGRVFINELRCWCCG